MRRPDEGGRSAGEHPAPHGPSLGDVLAWLDHHVNLEAIEAGHAGRAAEPDLSRIRALLSAMGDPQVGYPVLQVTGTNGKGSTTRIATALLEAQGLAVGSYTSPHLERLNERIAFGGEPIGDDALAEVLGSVEELERFLLGSGGARRVLDEPPTWFELMTATAYRYFADVAVEAAVVEVGMGGRFDATNVANAAVAAVTNVELDHVEILGPTRLHIAREKAGIIKAGSIVVVGEEDPEIVEVFAEEGHRVGAEALWRREVDFAVTENHLAHGGRLLDLRTPGASYDDVYLALHGPHQGENASVALAAVEAFFGSPLDAEVVAEAFASVRVPGRLEVMARRPLVLLDGAHNVAGAQALGAALSDDFAGADKVVVVLGCLRGRDPAALLAGIGPERVSLVVACQAPSPRALPAEEVAAAARGLELATQVADEVGDALEIARQAATEDDIVLVTGSLYVVGEARALLRRGR
ncbi:MAG: folC [Acidimicrobiaceae bacterium]|nr:folC [Acidimicrobiaceae bacterium]